MKKNLLFLILLFPFFSNAQDFWTEVAPFTTESNYYVKDISIVDNAVVWVSGKSNENNGQEKWSLSLDGGETWISGNIDLGEIGSGVANIHAISATTAYVAVYPTTTSTYCGIWITHDSGTTWTRQDSAAFNTSLESFANFIHFWDENSGLTVGDPVSGYFEAYTTTNGGNNWTRIPSANFPTLLENEYGYTNIYTTNGDVIWFGTNKGRVFKSTDKGLHWVVSQSPVSNFGGAENNGVFDFKNLNNGLLVNSDFDFFQTTNGGNNWIQQAAAGSYRNGSIQYVPETTQTYFSFGNDINSSRGSSYSTDGGSTWIDLNTVDADPVIPVKVEFKNGNIGFCIGSYMSEQGSAVKRFYKLTDPLQRLLSSKNFNTSTKFTMSPNPASDIVTISGKNITSISVFDITGKKVLNENFPTTDSAILNISKLQNGIYLAEISNDLNITSTIKIVKK